MEETAIVPVARVPIEIRPAVAGDYAFIDRLQDMHSKNLGFLRKAALETKIARGEILIADDETRLPIGYCIWADRYFKRDEVGIIYQMNIAPSAQRKLVAATLLKGVFERAPYGCKLFSCWCAQDLDANYFWESMGFIPLAFRTGAVGRKVRTHIFWQRRIRAGDTTTSYWYPCKTDGGQMRADRIVLPIPPGVHWKDEMPILVPEVQNNGGLGILPECSSGAILDSSAAGRRKRSGETPKPQLMPPTTRRVRFGRPGVIMMPPQPVERIKAQKKPKPKANPKHVAAARELRDRYLEQFNSGLLLPQGKYQVSRAIEAKVEPLLLPQAA